MQYTYKRQRIIIVLYIIISKCYLANAIRGGKSLRSMRKQHRTDSWLSLDSIINFFCFGFRFCFLFVLIQKLIPKMPGCKYRDYVFRSRIELFKWSIWWWAEKTRFKNPFSWWSTTLMMSIMINMMIQSNDKQAEQTQNQILNHTIFHIDQCLDG